MEPITGSSIGWLEKSVTIPAGTTHIRFRYNTDTYYQGRGWYISTPQLTTTENTKVPLKWETDGWVKRNY